MILRLKGDCREIVDVIDKEWSSFRGRPVVSSVCNGGRVWERRRVCRAVEMIERNRKITTELTLR